MKVGDVNVRVVRRGVKHLRLSVCPPSGEVVITAPLAMDEDAVRLAAVQRLSWIHARRREFENQERQSLRTYESGETHYFLGRRYRLKVVSVRPGSPHSIERKGKFLMMNVYPETTQGNREELLHAWYRRQLRDMATPLLDRWCKRLKLSTPVLTIRKMKTKWGSCAPNSHRIQLNMDLIKKPPLCIEYVVLHELIHSLKQTIHPGSRLFWHLSHAHVGTFEGCFESSAAWRRGLGRNDGIAHFLLTKEGDISFIDSCKI